MEQDIRFMKAALEEAKKAMVQGEVPVGAVLVRNGKIIARGHNKREKKQAALAHAELIAIEKGCRKLKSWRLDECELYVTLEPCPMCAGAIINARVKRVIYGADDPKAGSVRSMVNLFDFPYNHKPQVTAGVLEEPCGQILTEFFQKLRKR